MSSGIARLAGWMCAGVLVVQETTEPAREDLTKLTLDEVIDRLPTTGSEWVREGKTWSLVPSAAEFRNRIEYGNELTAEQWKHALFSTGSVRMRQRWPSSKPFAVSMRDPGWLRYTEIRLDPHVEGLSSAEAGWLNGPGTCGTYSSQVKREWLYQPLGSLPLGNHTLSFELTLERGRPYRSRSQRMKEEEPFAPTGVFFRGEFIFDLEMVAAVDEAVPPVGSPELDDHVRQSLSLAFDDWSSGRIAIFVADPDIADPILARLGLSLEIELWQDGKHVEVLHLTPSTYDSLRSSISVHDRRNQPFAFATVDALPLATENDFGARAGWSVHVKGTSQDVLALWEADGYWSGEMVLSLDELIRREREVAPSGRGPWVYMPTFR